MVPSFPRQGSPGSHLEHSGTHSSVAACSTEPQGSTRSPEQSANAPRTIPEHIDPVDTQYLIHHHDSSGVPVGFNVGPMQCVGDFGWPGYQSIPWTNLPPYSSGTNEQATNLTTIKHTADTTTASTDAEPTCRVQHMVIDRYESA